MKGDPIQNSLFFSFNHRPIKKKDLPFHRNGLSIFPGRIPMIHQVLVAGSGRMGGMDGPDIYPFSGSSPGILADAQHGIRDFVRVFQLLRGSIPVSDLQKFDTRVSEFKNFLENETAVHHPYFFLYPTEFFWLSDYLVTKDPEKEVPWVEAYLANELAEVKKQILSDSPDLILHFVKNWEIELDPEWWELSEIIGSNWSGGPGSS